jgi:membrane-bound metal-dependent hydrolase YbcI (DUF457 family)
VILWHFGATVLIVRYVFRDPDMDLRWVLAGSILPDLIDKPIASVFFHDTFGTHRIFAHSIVFPMLAFAVVLVATKRGTNLRRGLIGAVIGVFIHLLLDAAWATPEAFWWPFFGLEFPRVLDSDLMSLLGRMLSDPLVWAGEAAGAAYLVLLWSRYLRAEGALRQFFRANGRIGLPTP